MSDMYRDAWLRSGEAGPPKVVVPAYLRAAIEAAGLADDRIVYAQPLVNEVEETHDASEEAP